MTIFFDLPLDIRQIIWRKTRFLSAQDSIKHIFRKPGYYSDRVRRIDVISIEFKLTYTKTMTIETIIYEDQTDTLVVDIKDQNYIKVYLHPLNDENEVQLYLSTKFNKRSFNYRKKTIDSPIINYYRNNEIYVCKYCSSISDRTYTIINR